MHAEIQIGDSRVMLARRVSRHGLRRADLGSARHTGSLYPLRARRRRRLQARGRGGGQGGRCRSPTCSGATASARSTTPPATAGASRRTWRTCRPSRWRERQKAVLRLDGQEAGACARSTSPPSSTRSRSSAWRRTIRSSPTCCGPSTGALEHRALAGRQAGAPDPASRTRSWPGPSASRTARTPASWSASSSWARTCTSPAAASTTRSTRACARATRKATCAPRSCARRSTA